jgi:poly-beta-1,6-N-acetyl-D-glucosamine synthase
MACVFWASVLIIVYVYIGYPLVLLVWSTLAPRPVRKRAPWVTAPWPGVSVILAVRNEGILLGRRLSNLFDQRYPGPLEIIVVSDGSTDDTRTALAPFSDRVRLVELPRSGKPMALNAGVAVANGQILLFADARQRFAAGAIVELVANFDDPDLGGVSGELILECESPDASSESSVAEGVGLYWTYEKWLRRHESSIGSTLGTTGAIHAMRRELWQPLPASTILDDVLAPMRLVLSGNRVVFDDRALAYDRAAATAEAESRRKRRTLAGNYQILALEPRLLVPFINPVWLQYVSHKLGRLVVPWALGGMLLTSVVMAPRHWWYLLALMLQLAFYGLAAFGGWLESRERNDRHRVDDLTPAASHDRAL